MSEGGAMQRELAERGAGMLPGHMGLTIEPDGDGGMRGWFEVAPHHLAPNGFLHAASVVALADSACGYGCFAELPEGASGFTTVELKSNFVGTAREGRVETVARRVHGGRTTEVWDATVTHAGRAIAYVRCTQMILWPRARRGPRVVAL